MNDRIPNGLNDLRKRVTDYFTNPQKFIDFSTAVEGQRWDGENYVNEMRFIVKPLSEVANIVELGSGGYANVYAIDDKRVLKVIKTKDDGYSRFVEQVRKYRSNPHFPKIFYSGVWGGKTVYVLERLSSTPENGSYEMNDHFRSAVMYASDNPFITHTTKHIAEVARICKEICADDLHSGNLMFRGDVPVVTDPCT